MTADSVYIVRDTQNCPNTGNSWPLVSEPLVEETTTAPAPAGDCFSSLFWSHVALLLCFLSVLHWTPYFFCLASLSDIMSDPAVCYCKGYNVLIAVPLHLLSGVSSTADLLPNMHVNCHALASAAERDTVTKLVPIF